MVLSQHHAGHSSSDKDSLAEVKSPDISPPAKPQAFPIPQELSFDEIIRNKTLPPCSLNEFMDYMVYVEQRAETLQFFLWYCNYVERWSRLLPRQKSLAPVWDPAREAVGPNPGRGSAHHRARSEKLDRILATLEKNSEERAHSGYPAEPSAQRPMELRNKRSHSASTRYCRQKTSLSDCSIVTDDSQDDWQPFTIQPFHDEVIRVVRHYIVEGAPRQLSLSASDREACLRAVRTTTHPSALLPALDAAEATLRDESHPAFVGWSFANGNRARVVFLRAVGALLVTLAFLLDGLLIASSAGPLWRLLCPALWWAGFSTIFAGFRGVCMLVHASGTRQLRPWEQFPGEAAHAAGAGPAPPPKAGPREEPHGMAEEGRAPPLPRRDTGGSVSSSSSRSGSGGADGSRGPAQGPVRKPSQQTFGPRNDFADEPWVELYRRKAPWRKVFETTTPAQNAVLAGMRARVVWLALLVGGLVAAALTAGSMFIPGQGLL